MIMGFPDMYGRMMGKRFDADFFLDSAAKDGTHACDYLLASDMEMVPIPVRVTTLSQMQWIVRSTDRLCQFRAPKRRSDFNFSRFSAALTVVSCLGLFSGHVLAGHGLCQLGARLRR